MTVKELSEFTGKDERTIRRWINKAADKMSSVADKMSSAGHGKIVDYEIDEVEAILNESSLGINAVLIVMANARKNEKTKDIAVSGGVDYAKIGEMIGIAVSKAITEAIPVMIKTVSSLQIEPPKEDYYSLVAFCSLNGIKTNRSELATHGRELRIMAKEKGFELKKIPDERWGQVNSYPVEILNEYFAV